MSISTTSGPLPLWPGNNPGVKRRQINSSYQTAGSSPVVVSVVAGIQRGPVMTPTPISTWQQYQQIFGPSNPQWSYAGNAAFNILTSSGSLLVTRVVNTDAMYSALTLENDQSGPGITATRLFPDPNGETNPYTTLPNIYHVTLSGPILSGQSVSVSVTVGANASNATATYATSNDATLASFGQAILTAVETLATTAGLTYTGAYSSIIYGTTGAGSGARTLRIVVPSDIQISFSGFASSPSGITATFSQPTLCWFYAQNPGAWANGLGISISNIAAGQPQQLALNFSEALTTGNTISASITWINSSGVSTTTAIPPVAYATSNNATLTAFATAIQTAIGNGYTAAVPNTGGSTGNNTQVVITSGVSVPNAILISYINISGGTSTPLVTAQIINQGITPGSTFNVNVFDNYNTTSPVETWTVSLNPSAVNGSNANIFIENVINSTQSGSQYLRVSYSGVGMVNNPYGSINGSLLSNTVTWMTGGSDGSLPTDSQIIAGWSQYQNTDSYKTNIMISCGYSDPVVLQYIAMIATNRMDCMAFLDVPSNSQSTTGVSAFRTQQLNLSSTFGRLCTPDHIVLDPSTKQNVYAPPSIFEAYLQATVVKNNGPWFPNAGSINGNVPMSLGLRVDYQDSDRRILNAIQVDCFRKMKSTGQIVLWGNNTLSTVPSMLSFASVQYMMIYCQNIIADTLEQYVFLPANSNLEFLITQNINSFLNPIINAGGLQNALVVCNNLNNFPNNLDAGQVNVTVYFLPTPPADIIVLTADVTDGITFTQLTGGSV